MSDSNLLVFVTGGWAQGKVANSLMTVGALNGEPGVAVAVRSERTRSGSVIGGGVAYKFRQRWSATFEYLHYQLGSEILTLDYSSVPGFAGNSINYSFHTSGNIARVALNLHFQ